MVESHLDSAKYDVVKSKTTVGIVESLAFPGAVIELSGFS